MAVQHKNLPENQLHEPKGVSTATAGSVYAANGAGSGGWTKLNLSNFTGLAGDAGSNNYRLMSNGIGGVRLQLDSSYGALGISSNNAALSVTAATDSTLNTNTDYVLLNGAGVPWVPENVSNITVGLGGLQVQAGGLYSLAFWASISGFPADTSSVAFKLRVNGVPYNSRKMVAKSVVASAYGSVGFSELMSLTTGDVVQIYVASSVSGGLVIDSGYMSINLIKAA